MSKKANRRQFSGEKKVEILKRHLVDRVPVSDVCDEHGLSPTIFYRWQKAFFENGAAAFDRQQPSKPTHLERKIGKLEAKLQQKNEVVAEIMSELIAEKKRNGEI